MKLPYIVLALAFAFVLLPSSVDGAPMQNPEENEPEQVRAQF